MKPTPWMPMLLAGSAWMDCAAAPALLAQGVPVGSAAASTPAAGGHAPAAIVQAALEDAARRTGLPVSAWQVLSTESSTWPDGSLGCALPGVRYTMAPVSGWRIVVGAGERRFDYRAGTRGWPLLCTRGGAAGGLPQR